jgi:hypothetical protein
MLMETAGSGKLATALSLTGAITASELSRMTSPAEFAIFE